MKEKRFSSGIALFTSITALLTLVLAYNTPPLSGPFCQNGCFQYPYLDIASRFPRDYYWMFPTMVFLITYLIMMICIRNRANKSNRLFGQIGAVFATISTTVLLIVYFTQISIVQPSLLKNETDGISLFTQFNPHGFFIAMEELGFIVMSLSFLFAGLTFSANNKLEKWIKWIFISSFILTTISLILITIGLGLQREYVFEVASISFTWLTLIINGFLLYKLFKRD